eukprot:11971682-Alexandrium_andersonii.AAC.1
MPDREMVECKLEGPPARGRRGRDRGPPRWGPREGPQRGHQVSRQPCSAAGVGSASCVAANLVISTAPMSRR